MAMAVTTAGSVRGARKCVYYLTSIAIYIASLLLRGSPVLSSAAVESMLGASAENKNYVSISGEQYQTLSYRARAAHLILKQRHSPNYNAKRQICCVAIAEKFR